MNYSEPELTHLLQSERIKHLSTSLGREEWLLVYNSIHSEHEFGSYFCALIPNDRIEGVKNNTSWDIHIGQGMPGCSISHSDGKEKVQYEHYAQPGSIMPLVIIRKFNDIKPDYIEVLEEFRFFHNLYHDTITNTYIKINDDGEEEDIIRIKNRSVMIKLRAIKQFLAIKEMHIAIYFDFIRYSKLNLTETQCNNLSTDFHQDDLIYILRVAQHTISSREDSNLFSRLLGKKIIPGYEKEKSGVWPYTENQQKQYVDFIIGIDEHGEEILHSSNPGFLANYFGANPDAPHYLTPVFFRREVLNKYYSNSAKYTVRDGILYCASLWSIRIDNNADRYIIVYLGDLGRDLSYKEQLYWRSFNVRPDGSISSVEFQRGFMAEFADPTQPDLVFKYRFQKFQEDWHRKYGWDLFKPLSEGDDHLFASLRIPLSDDQSEFDTQVLAITKLLIDSLNEQEISQDLVNLPKDAKGITKLQKYLERNNFSDTTNSIQFLRNLQSLRSSGVGHRKSKEYQKIATTFQIGQLKLQDVFIKILVDATKLVDALSQHFITEAGDHAANK
jgi:hypothetical protein